MGMYTEIYVKISLKESVDDQVVSILKYMMGVTEEEPVETPEHDLFGDTRWRFMLRCSSYYHVPKSVGEFWFDDIAGQWFLVSRSDLKNYNGEIEKFFDWISKHVECSSDKTFLGYSLYEEACEPILYYKEV